MENNERRQRGFWNYETCLEAAKKCGSIAEFDKNFRQGYKTALKNGWLKEYVWFKKPSAWNKKWTRETCLEAAKQCGSRGELQKKFGAAYEAARENCWLDDYTWFVQKCKPTGYWAYENCYAEAKKYTTLNDFQKQGGSAYRAAWRNGWIKDYSWLERKCKPNGFWNKESCYEEAKKYKTKSEFERNAPRAYALSRKNEWLADYTWFEKGRISDKNIYVVYCYKDEENNSVYVGLTNNLKVRHKQHCKGHIKRGKLRFDVVYKHFHSFDKEIPEPIVLKDKLYAEEAKHYEGYYIEVFGNDGMNVLNIAKAGSVGAFGKWTKEKCYEEAKKYKSRSEFASNCKCAAYQVARENGWLDDYVWFEELKKENGYWNDYNICYEKAKECTNRKEFGEKYGTAYYWARKNGWIDDYTWFSTLIKWNHETCFEEAKKAISKADFKRKSCGAYRVARVNGWLTEYTWFSNSKKPNGYWTKEKCYEAAKQCKTNKEFRKNFKAACSTAYQNGWYKEYSWFDAMCKPNGYWTRERCYDEAKKYESKSDFRRGSSTAYSNAYENGWLNDYIWFQKPTVWNKKWYYESCLEESKKYSSRGEFRKYSAGAYNVSIRNGWLDEFFPKSK